MLGCGPLVIPLEELGGVRVRSVGVGVVRGAPSEPRSIQNSKKMRFPSIFLLSLAFATQSPLDAKIASSQNPPPGACDDAISAARSDCVTIGRGHKN